jgi:glutaredoxin-like protein NrdH
MTAEHARPQRILIYTKTDCQACKLTKQIFDEAQVAYTEHDVTDDDAMRTSLWAAGHREMPVVVTSYEVWTGFRPAKIKGAINGKTR